MEIHPTAAAHRHLSLHLNTECILIKE